MAKITARREGNKPMVAQLAHTIQSLVDQAESDCSWGTYTVEFRTEAGKIRDVRRVINETWKNDATAPANGKPLTPEARTA